MSTTTALVVLGSAVDSFFRNNEQCRKALVLWSKKISLPDSKYTLLDVYVKHCIRNPEYSTHNREASWLNLFFSWVWLVCIKNIGSGWGSILLTAGRCPDSNFFFSYLGWCVSKTLDRGGVVFCWRKTGKRVGTWLKLFLLKSAGGYKKDWIGKGEYCERRKRAEPTQCFFTWIACMGNVCANRLEYSVEKRI